MWNRQLCLVHSTKLKSSHVHTLKYIAYACNNRLFSLTVPVMKHSAEMYTFSVQIQTKLKTSFLYFIFFCIFIQFLLQCSSRPVEFHVSVCMWENERLHNLCGFTYLTARFLCMIHANWATVNRSPSREASGFLTSPTWWMSPVRSCAAKTTLFCHHVTRGDAVISRVSENIQVSSQWMSPESEVHNIGTHSLPVIGHGFSILGFIFYSSDFRPWARVVSQNMKMDF